MSKSEVISLQPKAVGQSFPRKEDAALLTGCGQSIADIVLPGMLHAAFVRPPYAHARITKLDASAAEAVPGVGWVWTGAGIKRHCAGMPATLQIENFVATTQPLLADDEVRFVGEAVAVVVATSRRLAEDAAALIEVDYAPLPVVANVQQAQAGAVLANAQVPGNVIHRMTRVSDDVDSTFANAALVVHGEFHNNRISTAPLETRGGVARHDWTSDLLTFWSSTQMPGLFRTLVATILQIPEQTIEIIIPQVGGGCGQKAHLFVEELVLCLLARELGKPVSWIEDRRENLLSATHAKHQINDLTIALDATDKMLAIKSHSTTDAGAYNNLPWTAAIESTVGAASLTGAYKIPLAYADCVELATKKWSCARIAPPIRGGPVHRPVARPSSGRAQSAARPM